jgi:hypothetical protein
MEKGKWEEADVKPFAISHLPLLHVVMMLLERRGKSMTKKILLIVAEVLLILMTIGIIVATCLPAIWSWRHPGTYVPER